jgi:hypothetical protein
MPIYIADKKILRKIFTILILYPMKYLQVGNEDQSVEQSLYIVDYLRAPKSAHDLDVYCILAHDYESS